LIARIERGMVPAHKLRHGKRFCWKLRRSELVDLQDGYRHDKKLTIQ